MASTKRGEYVEASRASKRKASTRITATIRTPPIVGVPSLTR